MQELQAMAREDGIALTLFPWDKGQVSQSKLTKFYKGQGFKPIQKGGKSLYWGSDVNEAELDPRDPDDVSYDEKVERIKNQVEKFASLNGVNAILQPWKPSGQTIGIELTDLYADNPGSGGGSKVMMLLCKLADEEQISIYLRPESARNRNEFYPRFNFENDKRHYGFMVRYPPFEDIDEAELDPRGWGETPQGTDIDYFGLKVKMRPSTFLKLSHPLGASDRNADVEKHMQGGGKIAYPFLEIKDPVEWEDGDFSQLGKVSNHEGRNRMTHWIKMKGDEPIQVNVFLRGANRRRFVTNDMIQAMSQGLISQTGQLVKNPFDASTALEETRVQGDRWTGDEPYRQLVELDDLEEDWKNWVAGGAMALGALGAANQYNSPVEPVRTAKISKITQPDAAPEVQVKAATPVVKAASPTVDTQAENVLYQTAKKEGMKGSELAQFLAQTKHETWNFSRLQEKPQPKVKDYFAKKYDVKHSPRTAKILGNKQVGDGARYHGRGYIQLTGRDNYRMAGDALKINLLKQPELAARPDIALKVALWYWNTRVKPGINNFDDTAAVTKKINSSLSGLEDRHANFIDYKKRIKST
jgi:predicted chitinase